MQQSHSSTAAKIRGRPLLLQECSTRTEAGLSTESHHKGGACMKHRHTATCLPPGQALHAQALQPRPHVPARQTNSPHNPSRRQRPACPASRPPMQLPRAPTRAS